MFFFFATDPLLLLSDLGVYIVYGKGVFFIFV